MAHAVRTWRPDRPVDVRATVAALRRGGGDPAMRFAADGGVWRATRTPAGPALLHVAVRAGVVEGTAWGEGRDWVLEGLPDLLGARDDDAGFRPRPEHPALVQAWRQRRGWRVPRSGAVFEALAAAAIEQVVTGLEARRAWRRLVHRFGEPAPGPAQADDGPAAGMRLPPTPREWALIPTWEWLRAGVEERRRRVVQVAARSAGRLEQTVHLPHADAARALRSLPGVGVWTAAEVRQRAHGDADAFSFGDYHAARNVSWALTGRVLDDDGCAEVIACYEGHRYRVQRLLELAGVTRPRFGPRMTLPRHTPAATRGRS
ncbi:MAG: DNA-3-methyladenine glycosylase family protein [Actinomycetes bacterium]